MVTLDRGYKGIYGVLFATVLWVWDFSNQKLRKMEM